MLATLRSSTNTCGASRISARGRSGYFPAKMSEIEPPSLWPSRMGRAMLEFVEQLRQHDFAFVVHELDRALLHQLVGAAVPIARIDEHSATGARGQLLRKMLPQRDRAQAFMQHDNRRPVGLLRLDPQRLQPLAVNHNFAALLMQVQSLFRWNLVCR